MTITRKTAEQLRVAQRAMERIMLGVTIREKIRNTHIRQKTKLIDVVKRVASLKWQWIGHVARQDPDRWPQKVILWRPRGTTRSVGRPKKRWVDDVRAVAGRQWIRLARDREAWKNLEEAYIQHWMEPG